jgi:hypothetical protein
MSSTWTHDEIFPIIAQVIKRQYRDDGRYIPSREIASALLLDPEAKIIIANTQSQQREHSSPERTASTMVAWFGQKITIGKLPWKDDFERIKIDGRWAYRPVTTTPKENEAAPAV